MLEITPTNDGLKVRTPAKVNLTLRVLGIRDDGYHALESLVCAVSLFDTLDLSPADSLTLVCDDPAMPTGDDNLVMKAARLLARECGKTRGARIRLQKRIPAGRGFGGGSSDAAATLAGLDRLWGCGLASYDLAALGAKIGSDVPLFFGSPCSVMRGRGEQIEPVDAEPPWHLVLAWPDFGLPTLDVYKAYDRLPEGANGAPAAATEILERLDSPAREARLFLVNDLEPAAAVVRGPRTDVRAILQNAGAAATAMTGSGSAYFALADTPDEAERVAQAVRAAGVEAWPATFLANNSRQKEPPS